MFKSFSPMFFSGKYLFLCFGHLLLIFIIWNSLLFFASSRVNFYISILLNSAACMVIGYYTFILTKRKFLTDQISPYGKAVLITGCDTGFGHEFAKRLDSRGYHVFAACLFPSGSGAEELKKVCSDRLKVLEMDVVKNESVEKAFEYVKNNLSNLKLWAVVNNAGIVKGFDMDFSSVQDFKDTMEVNGFGVVRVTKTFLPLIKQSKGRIVNITSVNGRVVFPHMITYVMSKYAAAGFSDCLTIELSYFGIRVIQIEPQVTLTRIIDPKELGKRFDLVKKSLDPNTLSAYGENYFKDFINALERNVSRFAPVDMTHVIDDMESAVSAEHPEMIYRPNKSYFIDLALYLYRLFPYYLQFHIVRIGHCLLGFPQPQKP